MHDEVDELIEAWGRERPDLDCAPMAVLSRVDRLSRHLAKARRAIFASHGLEVHEFDVLAALRRSGPPYERSPGALMADTMVTSGTMTNRLDGLERRRLVTRRRDPDDGRGVVVALTDAGRNRADAALAALLASERALLEALSDRQRANLAGALRVVLAPLDAPDG